MNLEVRGVSKRIPLTLTFPLLIGAIFFPKKKFLTLFNFSDFLHFFFSFEDFITNHIVSLRAKVKDKQVVSVFYYMHGFLFLSSSLSCSTQPALGLKEVSISERRGKEQEFPSLTVTDATCDCDFFLCFLDLVSSLNKTSLTRFSWY